MSPAVAKKAGTRKRFPWPKVLAWLWKAVLTVLALLVAYGTWQRPRQPALAQKEISYAVSDTSFRLSQYDPDGNPFTVRGKPLDEAFGFNLRCWNSGEAPLEHFTIDVRFVPGNKAFRLLSSAYETTPLVGFGKIEEGKPSQTRRTYRLELMNPGNEIAFSFAGGGKAQIQFGATCPGLVVRKRPADGSLSSEPLLSVGQIGLFLALAIGAAGLYVGRVVTKDVEAVTVPALAERMAFLSDTTEDMAAADALEAKGGRGLEIISARYGAPGSYADVTDILTSSVSEGRVRIVVNDGPFGCDPAEGKVKSLRVRYRHGGVKYMKHVGQGDTLSLP